MILFLTIMLSVLFATSSPAVQRGKLVSFAIPDNRVLKKALGYLEDSYLNFTELTTKYGYFSEHHRIITEDGYILSAFRILPKCYSTKFPVLLVHGIVDSSDTWVHTGPRKSLGYILSDNCYDVWAMNFRGNTYSREHLTLDPDKDPEYWEFSFDEIGFFDVPAVIDYIIKITKLPKVYYVGHSQGTTEFYIMGSLRPEYNDKIQLSVLLAPVAWMKNIKSPLLKLISQHTRIIKEFLDNVGIAEIFAKQQLLHLITAFFCQLVPNLTCGTVLAIGNGYRLGTIPARNLAVASGHILLGISVKTLAHFGQLIMSGNFQQYDEGMEGNLIKYGTSFPPKYNVSLVTSPAVLVCAESDWLSTAKDIDILSSKVSNIVKRYIVPIPTWSHNNYLWDDKAAEYVYKIILKYFQLFAT